MTTVAASAPVSRAWIFRAWAALVALGFLFAASNAAAKVFEPTRFVLDNGLELVVIEDHRRPAVAHYVFYKVGSVDEEAGKTGLAHFLEHLMFKGSKTLDPDAFSRIIARNGGRDNAFTSRDVTAYYQLIAANRLEMVMGMEAGRMNGLTLDETVTLAERDVVLEERLSRVESRPSAILGEMLNASLYLAHPYRRPVIGWLPEIEKLSREDALAFYKRWYMPNNAVVVVAGDVDPAEVRAIAERTYGEVPRGPEPVRDVVKEPDQRAPRHVVYKDARVRQPNWRRLYVAPTYQDAGPEAYALDVLSRILGGDTGRLHKKLVVEGETALQAAFWYDGDGRYYGSAGLYGLPKPGVEMASLEDAFDAEIARLLQDGVTEEEVADAKRRLVAQAVFARDSLDGPARIVGMAIASGQTVEDIEAWPARIEAVTKAEVDAAAKALFRENWSATGWLMPADKDPS